MIFKAVNDSSIIIVAVVLFRCPVVAALSGIYNTCMPRILRNLKINEVSGVDRGAGRGVKIMLMKRDTDDTIDWTAAKAVRKSDETSALQALSQSIASIVADQKVTDPVGKISESIAQFNEFISQEETEMTPEEINAAIAQAVDPLKAEIGKRDDQIALLKMSDKAKAYHDTLPEEAQKAFRGKKPAEQDNDADEDDRKKKSTSKRDTDVDKRFEDIVKRNSELEKMLGGMIAKERSAEFTKRAVEAGLKADDGEVMRKAFDGDVEAQSALTKRFAETTAALKSQVKTNVLFGEFGKAGPDRSANAYQALEMKAAELRKVETKLSQAQAFSKVYIDPANADLVSQHKLEEAQRKAAYIAAGGQ